MDRSETMRTESQNDKNQELNRIKEQLNQQYPHNEKLEITNMLQLVISIS